MSIAEQGLPPLFFPHSRICQVPDEQVRAKLIEVFEHWGQPGAMRVDNGAPLGDPTMQTTSALALWLIAMDVDMIWNRPACPTQNARVEKMQDTTARWAEVSTAGSLANLDEKLREALRLQRESYPVVRLGGQTRLQAFPLFRQSAVLMRFRSSGCSGSMIFCIKNSIPAK